MTLGAFNRRRGLEVTPESPSTPAACHGCKNAPRCQSLSLACDALAVFEAVGASAARLAFARRLPSTAIFERIQTYRVKRKAPPPFRRPATTEDEAD
jgi:hypothetical protein